MKRNKKKENVGIMRYRWGSVRKLEKIGISENNKWYLLIIVGEHGNEEEKWE